MLDASGRRSFGALLLLPGLVVLSPLSGIPGLPTTFAVIVLLVATQLLGGRQRFWFPKWILRRSTSADKLCKAVRFLRPIARFADRISRPRWPGMVTGAAVYVIAASCFVIALTMPPLEIIPFANSVAGAALTVFGLSLIAEDGLLASIAIAICVAGAALLIMNRL
jgi:hypothetical protein